MGPVDYHPVFHLLDLFPFVGELGPEILYLGPDFLAGILMNTDQHMFVKCQNSSVGFQSGHESRKEFICDLCADELSLAAEKFFTGNILFLSICIVYLNRNNTESVACSRFVNVGNSLKNEKSTPFAASYLLFWQI